MELEYVRTNYGWMAHYYKSLQGAAVKKIYIGVSDDSDMIVCPVIEFELTNGETYLCDVVCANDLEAPGFISGLPFDSSSINTPKIGE
jgi:hypothetical protein